MLQPYSFPEVAALELTYNCNHNCFFCSCPWEAIPRYRQAELSLDEWKDVINTLLRAGVNSFTLTGGEPLTRSDLKDIIQYISEKQAGIVLISNGREMNDTMLEYLSHYRITLCISLPGINSFQDHTGIDNVQNVLSIFEKARALGISTTANITVTKRNLNELYENIALPLIHGADYVLLNRFLPGGRGLNNTDYLLSVEETNAMLDIAEDVLSKAKRYGHVGTELPLCVIKKSDSYKHIQVGTKCAAAKGFCVIDPSGYLKVCNHSPIRVCHYSELNTLGNNEYWLAFQNQNYLPDMCMECDKKDLCDGGCREAAHVMFGKINDIDPIFYGDAKINASYTKS